MILSFVVPGPPQPKERPRRGKNGSFYTPGATRAYEETLKLCALAAVRTARWPLGTREPLKVTLHAFFPDARQRDVDNTAKVLDGANGVVWHDDSQIVELHIYKHLRCEKPRLEVTVEILLDDSDH